MCAWMGECMHAWRSLWGKGDAERVMKGKDSGEKGCREGDMGRRLWEKGCRMGTVDKGMPRQG